MPYMSCHVMPYMSTMATSSHNKCLAPALQVAETLCVPLLSEVHILMELPQDLQVGVWVWVWVVVVVSVGTCVTEPQSGRVIGLEASNAC